MLRFFNIVFSCLQKINQKNTWELNLIDHLTDIIKVEEENDVETNFQKVRHVDEGSYDARFLSLDLGIIWLRKYIKLFNI